MQIMQLWHNALTSGAMTIINRMNFKTGISVSPII